jgi:predicted GTPase
LGYVSVPKSGAATPPAYHIPSGEAPTMTRRVLIMGAAGRDFHNFNTVFREDPTTEVVAFTATQIPFINDRTYPASLAGDRYPQGIKIYDESELTNLIKEKGVDDVVFAYSDVSHEFVMHKGSEVMAAGANFILLGPDATMLDATVPVVSVCAVRTGSGKSQTTRAIAGTLKDAGKRVVAVRHPMPYGDLEAQRVQRYATLEDLTRYDTTIEEREEYEPHIVSGTVIYAGVDYGDILAQAQKECDVLLWDGGNNDLPFYRPTVAVVVTDPLRAGHETTYYPGETNLRMADVIVINKMDSAATEQVSKLQSTIATANPRATVVLANSAVTVDDPDAIAGKRVLVVEDGPTLTHGEMKFGAGVVAAQRGGAAEIVDPRPWAVGTLEETFRKYDVGPLLPAMGYSDGQLAEMEKIIDSADVDLVIIGTPIDLRRVINISKPAVRVRYDLEVLPGSPSLRDVLAPVL